MAAFYPVRPTLDNHCQSEEEPPHLGGSSAPGNYILEATVLPDENCTTPRNLESLLQESLIDNHSYHPMNYRITAEWYRAVSSCVHF